MKLKLYLSEKNLSLEQFADLVGASPFGVRKWITGERIPRKKALRRIRQITGGEVSYADFLEEAI